MSNDTDTPEDFMQRVAKTAGISVEELAAKCKALGERNAGELYSYGIDQVTQNKTARRVYHSSWKR